MNKIIATPADGITLIEIDEGRLAALEQQVIKEGRQQVVPASTYAAASPELIAALCVKHGLYGLVTNELVEFLVKEIAGRTALEVGAGDGVLAQALGIPAIDNRQQEWPDVRKLYERMQQNIVRYGPNITCLDGAQAVLERSPQVVVCNWVTHLYRHTHHEAGGNMYAPDERVLLANCETLLFVGNTSAHQAHPLLKLPHLHFHEPWLYSRAVRGKNFVGIWEGAR